MTSMSFREFTRRMIADARFTVDDCLVTPETIDDFSDEELRRGVYHGVALRKPSTLTEKVRNGFRAVKGGAK